MERIWKEMRKEKQLLAYNILEKYLFNKEIKWLLLG